MILILGEENVSLKIKNIRKKIQQEKNIHIKDDITLNQFMELYNEYGGELEKRIFGRYVLDISYSVLKNLGYNQKIASVFTEEKTDVERIKKTVLEKHNLHIGDEINYSQLIQLYNSVETIYNLKTFAWKILEINNNVFIQLKNNSNKKARILSRTKVTNSEILQIREEIKREYNIKENDKIDIKQFEKMYQKYGGILSSIEFAQRVLEIERKALYQLKRRGESAKTRILARNEILLSDTEIDLIREQISEEYDLYMDDFIDSEIFRQIFNKYKGKCTEKQLAEDIFGVPLEYFSKNAPIKIFRRIKLSEDRIKSLRDSIIEKEKLHSEDLITYKELQILHKKYGGILSINQFAINILDIPESHIVNMKTGFKGTILKNECLSLQQLEEITKKILKEYKLHINDTIDYKQFREMYEKYGGIMSERQFAEDVLDIPYRAISERIKYGGTTAILSSTIIPKHYIENLKQKILKETNLKKRQSINYQMFYQVYEQYGEFLQERYFAEEVLQISEERYYAIKANKDVTTIIFRNEIIDPLEFKQLKNRIIEENNLHIGDYINYVQFLKIYKQYPTKLLEKDFANVILSISKDCYNNIKYTTNARTRILKDEVIEDEEIEQKRKFFKQMEGKKINYDQFKKIYKQYSGKMGEFYFCEQILGFKLNFIKYYKTSVMIKDPIAKQKSIEIRKRFENETCRFFSKEEVNDLCKEYEISIKDFLNYVVLKCNFQFYKETEEAFQTNNGIWFGRKKIPLTRKFVNRFSDTLISLATGVTKNLAKTYRLNRYLQEDMIQELILKAMEEYGELERNFSYDIEEIRKRIGVRMKCNGLKIMCSHFKIKSGDISKKFYWKEKVGPDIQLIDIDNSVEEDAINNVSTEETEFIGKVIYAVRELAKNGNSAEKIQNAIMDYLRNRKDRFN